MGTTLHENEVTFDNGEIRIVTVGTQGPAGPSTIPAAVGVPVLINAYLRLTLQIDNSTIVEVLRGAVWTKIITWR